MYKSMKAFAITAMVAGSLIGVSPLHAEESQSPPAPTMGDGMMGGGTMGGGSMSGDAMMGGRSTGGDAMMSGGMMGGEGMMGMMNMMTQMNQMMAMMNMMMQMSQMMESCNKMMQGAMPPAGQPGAAPGMGMPAPDNKGG
jgi:hypothetical protein